MRIILIRHRFPRCSPRLLVLVVTALAFSACSDTGTRSASVVGSATSERPTIVVTTDIWADIVANVACGELTTIETLIPPGGDPHAYEPSLADRATMEHASLIVANGLNLEGNLEDTIAAVEDTGTLVIRMAEHIDGVLNDDPHIWFDPTRISAALPELATRLTDGANLDADEVNACLATYQDELAGIDADILEKLKPIRPSDRVLVTNHDSLKYFADRYGFEVVGTVIPASSTLAATSPGDLEDLATLIEERGVPAIFAETIQSTDDVDALAASIDGVTVIVLHTGLGDEPDAAATYIDFLRANTQLIATGLS